MTWPSTCDVCEALGSILKFLRRIQIVKNKIKWECCGIFGYLIDSKQLQLKTYKYGNFFWSRSRACWCVRELWHSLWVSVIISWTMEGKESSFLPSKKKKMLVNPNRFSEGFSRPTGSPETIPERPQCLCFENCVTDSSHPPFVGSHQVMICRSVLYSDSSLHQPLLDRKRLRLSLKPQGCLVVSFNHWVG